MTKEEYNKLTKDQPAGTVVVSFEDDKLIMTSNTNFVFTDEASIQPVLVEKMYVNFRIV